MIKFYFLLILIIALGIPGYSQNYSINNGFSNGATITTCFGTFYDSNPGGDYGVNENYTVTFCSGSLGKVIQVVFSSLNIATGDTLTVFDGADDNAPVLHVLTGYNLNTFFITPSLLNLSGCLTFRFSSNNTIETAGWVGEIRCAFPCTQRILASTVSIPAMDLAGYTNICAGDSVQVGLKTIYPDNGLVYRQADSSSYFHWSFGDGTDTLSKKLVNVKHLYKTSGGFYVKVNIIDSNGCSSLLPLRIPVRTSMRPLFNINAPSAMCLKDTVRLTPNPTVTGSGSVIIPAGTFVNLPVSGDSVFLPDNPPKCFTSTIHVDQYAPGQLLTNISDLKGIFMKMEHSYHGDISIAITAPNGTKVFLKSTVGGTDYDGTFLGEPVDESLNGGNNNPALTGITGLGYEYFFNSTPQYGTMWNEASKYLYDYVDNSGQTVTQHFFLPPGSYTSEQNLAALLGTPVNGSWTLEICDKQSYDNGFLFNWKIEFDPTLSPYTETYYVPVVSQLWQPAPGLLSVTNNTANVLPVTPGNYNYTYRVIDTFGCTYDTTVHIIANPIPRKPNLGPDQAMCSGRTITLSVLNPEPAIEYNWSTGQQNVPSIKINQTGSYWVQAKTASGCQNSDSIDVVPLYPFFVHLGNDTMFCASRPNELKAVSSANIIAWFWSTGDSTTTNTFPIKGPGIYWVDAKSPTDCKVRDSIIITENPINSFDLPQDTVICYGSSYRLSLSTPAGSELKWQDGSNGTIYRIDHAATYSIVANNKGCIRQSEMIVTTKPLPVINLGPDTVVCKGYDLPLQVSYPGAQYRWSTGSTDASIVAVNKGLYWVEATFNGCNYKDSIQYDQKICACDISMPSAFSPNGDGINDNYTPRIKCFPRSYFLTIYNRYGQQVYQSKDYRQLWDGKLNNQQLPVGTYYYILTFYNENVSKVETTKGSIALLR